MDRTKNERRSRKDKLYDKQGGRCYYCLSVTRYVDLTFDHKTPKVKGGKYNAANLVLACRLCNQDKGAHTVAEYQAILEERLGHPVEFLEPVEPDVKPSPLDDLKRAIELFERLDTFVIDGRTFHFSKTRILLPANERGELVGIEAEVIAYHARKVNLTIQATKYIPVGGCYLLERPDLFDNEFL